MKQIVLELTQELADLSDAGDCENCILVNALEKKFPFALFAIHPCDCGSVLPGDIYCFKTSDRFKNSAVLKFPLTVEQNALAIDFDNGHNIVGKVVEITEEQQNRIFEMLEFS